MWTDGQTMTKTDDRQETGIDTSEQVSIKVAAKALGVSTKTVRRYLESGKLTKVKDGHRVLIPSDEIRQLRNELGQGMSIPSQDTITLSIDKYNELLQELGQYKAQAQLMLEYKAELDQLRTRRPWWKRMFR
jgi:excisionase family DNA binding protein